MLLNDVHREEKRLAYLLGLSTERHVAAGKSQSLTQIVIISLISLLLLSIWLMAGVL
jgi:hypothetical protein